MLPFERVTLIASLNFLIQGVRDGLAEGKVAHPFIPDLGHAREDIGRLHTAQSVSIATLQLCRVVKRDTVSSSSDR